MRTIMHTDGGTWLSNPGKAGYGFVIYHYDKRSEGKYGSEIDRGAGFCGITTNNVAEYQALISGLERALELGITHIQVKADNMMMVQQVGNNWRAKADHLKLLQQEAQALAARFERFSIQHVPRAENSIADGLAREYLKERFGK